MLTNKQVDYLHEQQNRIVLFCQELREMGGEPNYYFGAMCHAAADSLMDGCFMLDDVILEGSAEGKETQE